MIRERPAGARRGAVARSRLARLSLGLVLLAAHAGALHGQTTGALTGRIVDAASGAPVPTASVSIEGTDIAVLSDSVGRYRMAGVPAGPQVLVIEHIAYATARVHVVVRAGGVVARDVQLAFTALQIPTLTVTTDPVGRARGELGTASVIDRAAIDVQSATSLAGVLELVPGAALQPPGLAATQQFSLRSVATSGVTDLLVGGPSAADLASFGTLILLDGVPLSNNANLQSTGPRGEVAIQSAAGGGVDLRRIPASTIERVEVIRGVPSARYGDLTQGAVLVDTRAGAFSPELRGLFDARSAGGSVVGGWSAGRQGAVALNLDVTRTSIEPGFRPASAYRVSSQLSHRAVFGASASGTAAQPAGRALTLDSRLDLFQVYEDSPEDPDISPGVSSSNRDRGFRLSERARLVLDPDTRLELTASVDHTRQRSASKQPRSRGAMPFTDRMDEGRATGRYIGGEYSAALTLHGDAWQAYTRLEADRRAGLLGLDHRVRAGVELRREWNDGPGYQFDIEFPPQSSFNGVQGFDRPRPFDAIPATATTGLYLDDRVLGALPGGIDLDLQAGLRLDVLHEGGHWFSGARDAVAQPRVNLQLSPRPWMRLRAGWGKTTKIPSIAHLYPPPQYYDIVNVNWFTPDPVERLAVVTTFIRDPSNPDLGFARATKAEAGIELSSGGGESAVSAVVFRDRTDGGVGFQSRPDFLLRDRYALADSVIGDGLPTEFLDPPTGADTIPILLDRPANNLRLRNEGVEVTARLPEIPAIGVRLEAQGAWIRTRLEKEGLDFGRIFGEFQLDERIPRAPFWESVVNTGSRGIATYRIIHHNPAIGLVVTGTVQHVFAERRQNVAGVDTLAFEGYVTRAGRLVRVPPEQRGLPEYADIRLSRAGVLVERNEVAPDWLLSLQISLHLPLDGRLSLYAFNVLDRPGRPADAVRLARFHPAMQFGLEGSIPLRPVTRALRAAAGRD